MSKKVTLQQILEINNLLKEHLVHTDRKTDKGEALWDYINGYSDAKIAEGVKCSVSAVYNIRQKLFGLVKRAKGDELSRPNCSKATLGMNQATRQRLDKIESRLDFIAAELGIVWPSRKETT